MSPGEILQYLSSMSDLTWFVLLMIWLKVRARGWKTQRAIVHTEQSLRAQSPAQKAAESVRRSATGAVAVLVDLNQAATGTRIAVQLSADRRSALEMNRSQKQACGGRLVGNGLVVSRRQQSGPTAKPGEQIQRFVEFTVLAVTQGFARFHRQQACVRGTEDRQNNNQTDRWKNEQPLPSTNCCGRGHSHASSVQTPLASMDGNQGASCFSVQAGCMTAFGNAEMIPHR